MSRRLWTRWKAAYWRTRSISTKLFALTSLLLIAFLTLLLVVQSNFFESYYQHKKMNQLEDELAAFAAAHYRSPDDLAALPKLIPQLESSLSATAAVVQLRDGLITLGPQTRTKSLIQMDKNGNVVSMSSQSPGFEPDTLRALIGAVQVFRNDASLSRRVQDLGRPVSFRSSAQGPLAQAAAAANSNDNAVAAVYPLSAGDARIEQAIIAVASLQPIGEAAGILKDFYVYFLLLAIAVILLLTYLYSRMITRPLKKLNAAAQQMAVLDFSARCDVRSQDELGSLGHTLNFLSGNLDTTLRQLNAANEQLKADIEREKQLEKERREFVASVSHELKTPISLIGGYAEGIRDGIVTGTRRDEYVGVILEETERMAGLVQDMLDLAQLESGKFKLQEAAFPLHELLRSVTEQLELELERDGTTCELVLEGPPAAYGDMQRIRQVLTNLLSNARKHTAAGRRIAVRACSAPEGVRVEVYNEGAAIPEAELPRLWESFYTVDKSRNRDLASGSGLGLAIVRNILTLHGSRFGAYNARGGVTFFFTLRVLEPPTEG